MPTFRDRELVENTGYGEEFEVIFLYVPCGVITMDRKVASSEQDAVRINLEIREDQKM